MSGAATDDRRELAFEAFYELQDVIEVLRRVEPDNWRAVRGLSLRAEALLLVLVASSGLDPEWSNAEQDRATIYGAGAADAEAAE